MDDDPEDSEPNDRDQPPEPSRGDTGGEGGDEPDRGAGGDETDRGGGSESGDGGDRDDDWSDGENVGSDPSDLPDVTGSPGLPADPTEFSGDAETTLSRLLDAARTALRDGDVDRSLAAVETADRVLRTSLPDDDRTAVMRHGCTRVEDLVEADPAVAAEYLDAMRRRLS